MKKRILVCILTVAMLIGLTPTVASAAEESYVEVNVVYPDGYETASVGNDTGAARIEEAERVLDQKFSSLEEAADAFLSLYSKEGNYEYNYSNVTDGTVGAFYVHVNDKEYPYDSVFRHPVVSVEYVIHGSVPAFAAETDATFISLGHNGSEGRAVAPEIILRGADENAKITGTVSITAKVAGGYPDLFTESGTFTVEGIEFTNDEGYTTIEADGSTLGGPDGKFADTTLNVKDNVFHNRYYSYVNDTTSENLVKNITDNQFIGENFDTYAYFLQGQVTTLNFERNTITGYARGLNIHAENDDCIANIVDNVISTDSRGCGSIQLTNAQEVRVTGNDIINPSGAAIRFYYSDTVQYAAKSTSFTENYIDCAYLFQMGDSPDKSVTFDESQEFIFKDNIVTRDTNVTDTPVEDGDYENELPAIVIEGDKRDLEDAIEAAQALNSNEYTVTSYAAFKKALEEAVAVIDDDNATQQIVDEAQAKLEDAYKVLEERVSDKTWNELKDLYEEALKLDSSLYTDSSWKPVAEALERIKADILGAETGDLSEDEIRAEIVSLQGLLDKLEKTEAADTEVPETGTAGTAMWIVLAVAAAAGAGTFAYKRNRQNG